MVGYDVLKGRTKLTEWYNRVKSELQPEFDEASAIVERTTKMYAEGKIPIPKL